MKKRLQIADLFCGAGGTSTGAVEAAEWLGYRAELTAINHWPVAIATHTANHPEARHLCTAIDDVNPRTLYGENELDLLWASPECTHHSVARGGRPINDQSRATAWCVVRWAEAVRPGVILIENVPEFLSWGGICADGRPLKAKKGATFHAWKAALESLGYRVDHRILCAADYGDPTTRKRLFVQAVRGKRRIVWPDPTHAAISEVDLFGGSRKAWVPAREIIDWTLPAQSIYERKKPLSPKTMNRIFEGLRKFGVKPSIVTMEHAGSVRSAEQPIPTVTTARGGAMGVAEPFLVELRGTSRQQVKGSARRLAEPLSVVSTSGAHHGLVAPWLVQVNHEGEDASRVRSMDKPMPTVCGNRGEWAMCDAKALLPQQSGGILRSVEEPAPTIATGGAVALVEPFLIEYYGTGGAESVEQPLNAVTTKDRHALVRPVVVIDGQRYLLDIRFRMLQPHELAAAQGFRREYQFTGNKSEQVKQIGNAVPRRLVRAIVAAVLTQKADVRHVVDVEVEAPAA
jgi:DNA (cytosine-5)-methyltransferase 1